VIAWPFSDVDAEERQLSVGGASLWGRAGARSQIMIIHNLPVPAEHLR